MPEAGVLPIECSPDLGVRNETLDDVQLRER